MVWIKGYFQGKIGKKDGWGGHAPKRGGEKKSRREPQPKGFRGGGRGNGFEGETQPQKEKEDFPKQMRIESGKGRKRAGGGDGFLEISRSGAGCRIRNSPLS